MTTREVIAYAYQAIEERPAMTTTVCFSVNALAFPSAGGHLWAYLNWALGLRAAGCRVIWLEAIMPSVPAARVQSWTAVLRQRLEAHGLHECLALCSWTSEPLPHGAADGCLDLDAAAESDLLLNQQYGLRRDVVERFRRSALLDIDPGLLQAWMHAGAMDVAPHGVYFTTGETVGRPGARVPDCGISWQYTAPCVMTDAWPAQPASSHAALTTLSSWRSGEWFEDASDSYPNDKCDGFLPYLDVPRRVAVPMELALSTGPGDEANVEELRRRGWSVVDAADVADSPKAYQRYVQRSFGEFSCAKPSCVRLQNAWLSDRTLCYLSSGRPAIVEHTGPSRILPDTEGLFRFRDVEEAASHVRRVVADYERQCRLARSLAVEHFDARKIVTSVLERALA